MFSNIYLLFKLKTHLFQTKKKGKKKKKNLKHIGHVPIISYHVMCILSLNHLNISQNKLMQSLL